jgi:hypothetical protein
MDHVKRKMSKKDMNSFIKSWQDFETGLDVLIKKQRIIHRKLVKDLKAIQANRLHPEIPI